MAENKVLYNVILCVDIDREIHRKFVLSCLHDDPEVSFTEDELKGEIRLAIAEGDYYLSGDFDYDQSDEDEWLNKRIKELEKEKIEEIAKKYNIFFDEAKQQLKERKQLHKELSEGGFQAIKKRLD